MLLCGSSLTGQNIVKVEQTSDAIVISYDLPRAADFVRLYVSTDGGKNFRGPMGKVSGDVKDVSAGFDRRVEWKVLEEFATDSFEEDDVRFKLSVVFKEKWPKETFVTLNGAYSFAPQASLGFSVGQVKHFGWFVSVMSNGGFSGFAPDGDCNDEGYTPDGYKMMFTGEKAKTRLSVIGGMVMRVAGPLCIRVGAGYGNRTLLWKTLDGALYRNTDNSVSGIDLSAGIQLNLKGFVLSVEAVTTQFRTMEGKIGVGYAF